VKASPQPGPRSGKLTSVDTRRKERLPAPGGYDDQVYEERGLGPWIQRNPWLLTRLFMVLVFSFGASTTAVNFSYGMEINPIQLSVEEINEGRLPPEARLQDFVEITGTPDFGEDTRLIGTEESQIGFVHRYSVNYFYFGLEETGDNLLIQTVPNPPDVNEAGEQVWRGQLSNVRTVIFHDSTQAGLENAGLTTRAEVPVIETGETPDYHRQIFPAYFAILLVWLGSVGWLIWRKNEPLLGA
jgi:hypothetical protein